MSVDYKVEKIYEEQIANAAKSKENWQGICKLIGQLYRYEFDNILMVNAQRPHATLIADYDTWKKVGRFVTRGSKGIAIFPSRALQPHMRYVFDISDTGGKSQNLTWDLEGDTLKNYLDFLVSEGQIKQYEGTKKKEFQSALKQFTGTNVWAIIRTDFEERTSELLQLTGSVIMDFNEKRKSLPQDSTDIEHLIYQSVMYAVGTRCGFDISSEEQDFSQIVKYSDEEIIYRLGTLVSDVSCSVLRELGKNLKTMERQRRTADERSRTYGTGSITVQGSRRTIVSTDSDATGGRSEADQSWQVRNLGDELLKGERKEPLQHTLPIRETGREDAGSGRGSEPSIESVDGGLPESPQAAESRLHNGDVAASGERKETGGGDRTPRGSDEVSLETEENSTREDNTENHTSLENDEELDRELEELNSFGKHEEAGHYEQASFFDAKNPGEIKSQYTYLEPKKELVVPHEYVLEVLKRGSGFSNGEKRIYDIFHNEMDANERTKQIKKEYGLGGVGWPLEGYGLHGYDSFKPQGLRFQWRDAEGEKEGYLSWKSVEQEIGVLILTGEYYQPPAETFDELEEQEQFDEYAIPDEPESYHSMEKNAQAAEDTANPMETEMFESEQEILSGEVTASEEEPKLEVIPTDYEKLILEMDEDLRGALEILVTDCSCYTPFKPFLQDLTTSEFLFMPNRLDFLSEIVLSGKEEHKAYCNNSYGLIEYTFKPYALTVNYKDRHGERITAETGYRELYEVLTYMAKQPYFCGADHRERYEKSLAGDRASLSPIYREFLDKQEEIRQNREKNSQRAKERGWNTPEDFINETANPPAPMPPKPELEVAEKSSVPDTMQVSHKHNFHYDMWELPKGGAKTRYKWNVEAIQLLKKLEVENRLATAEEQKTLSYYVGWGGLSAAFDENNQSWSGEYAELKELLSEEEYTAARATVNNAFYTSPEIASCMHQALIQFGFRKGNLLEPSMGVGNFFGSLPQTLQGSKLYGVELDSISGRIAKQLYQKADISITGFEKTTFPDNFFDVVIGNVPFGDYKVYDPKYNKHNLRIHDYFIAKAIDQVRPGGMVAVITTKGTLDKSHASFRKLIAQQAELVGAIRLPNTAFKENAGTEVTSDILFLQKRERKIDIEPDWVHLGYTENGIAVNSYFAEHPHMMLGHMEYDTRIYGQDSRYTVCVNDDKNFSLQTALSEAVQFISAQMTDFERLTEEAEVSEDILMADPEVRNFSYTFFAGELYYRENSQMYRKEVNQTVEDRIRFLDEIRHATRYLIDIQTEGCSEQELAEGQKILNDKYDTFTAKYGAIVDKGNRMAFRDDSDYPLLCSLEKVDAEGKVSKADMFYKQTIKTKVVIERVETAVEALNVSINEYGEVNIPYMLSLYQPDISSAIEAAKQENGEEIVLSESAKKEVERGVLIEELSGVIYLNPNRYHENDENAGWETADEYLSGNVRDKLRVAKAAAVEAPNLFAHNVQALGQVQPVDIEASDIDVRIGTTWIEPQDYEQFIYELLKTPQRARAIRNEWQNTGIQVHLNKLNMQWFIENKSLDKRSVAATKTYGTSREDAYSIFEDTLNLKTVTIRDRIDDGDGKYHYVVNKNETMLAREKQNQIKAAFKDWQFQNQERRQKYVQYYNETFNNIRLREYDGSYLQFPGMNPEITLDTHQKNAVARILLGGNTLLAHCVGAGKSFEMVAACMEQKRLGIANKTILVVPKAVIGQTATEFLRLYPSANVLVATERDFEKSRRKQFISRIATGDYDGIVMSHSQFEKIPISPERRERMLREQVTEISYAIDEMKSQNGERWTVKQMESQKKKLEEQISRLADESRKDDLINFEELGVDCIMVDEAHSFKNLAIFSKMNNVSGISSSGAKKSTDMQLKCQYLSEINDGRGVVFATGTPISNTMCELYVMQLYLQKEALERMGIYHFDSWAANFGEVTTALELTVEGSGFRFKSRFNKFTNLPELMNIFREVADVQTADMLNLEVPGLRGGKYNIVESEPDWYVKQVMEDFVVRAERIRDGGVDPSVDNFLKITHEARLLGTDARLLEPLAPNNADGKLNQVVQNVLYEHEKAKAAGIIGCQIIFSDIGTPKGTWESHDLSEKFDVYNYIKEELVKGGIPSEEIAYVHDAKNDAQRATLFKEMWTGKKRIMLGSTEMCGTGVNVQKHIVAMHHVDCPWKPSSIEQREGRGIRRGNDNEEIAVYRYVTKGTFDAYSWALVENKQRFISQVMTSKSVSRSCEDIDEATLSYAEIKAVATGNPMIREKMELDNEVQRLRLLKSSYDNQRYSLQDNYMIRFPKLIQAAKEKLSCVREDMKSRDAVFKEGMEFAIVVGNLTYKERADGGTVMLEAISKCKTGETCAIGKFQCFDLFVEKNFMGTNYLILRGKTDYKMELSTSPVGNMVKLENTFGGIQENEEFLLKKIEEYENDLEASKLEYEKPFAHEEELNEKLARQNEINTMLDLENGQVKDMDLSEESHEADRDEADYSVAEQKNRYHSERDEYHR